MAHIRVGQHAPDVGLTTISGREVKLSEAWGNGRHTLIIFLRHLA